jgi:hypothetical protein
MRSNQTPRQRSWLARKKMYFIFGVPLLWFVLSPYPFGYGMGMIYPIRDELRGHPTRLHGSHPQKLVGLWVRDEYVQFDFVGQAFYLMPNGRFASSPGMTQRQWHFDDSRLFIDSVSRCGNCYQGNFTTEHTITLVGADQIVVSPVQKENAKKGVVGTYRRVQVDGVYKREMERLAKSENEEEGFRGQRALLAITQFEVFSKLKR